MAIIDVYLQMGSDVIVEKMMRDETRLDRMIALARQKGADVVEIILWSKKDAVLKRAAERGYREDSLLTPEKCERFWNEIDALKRTRPHAVIIDVENLSTEAVIERIRIASRA